MPVINQEVMISNNNMEEVELVVLMVMDRVDVEQKEGQVDLLCLMGQKIYIFILVMLEMGEVVVDRLLVVEEELILQILDSVNQPKLGVETVVELVNVVGQVVEEVVEQVVI